jgi:hypothetical protein
MNEKIQECFFCAMFSYVSRTVLYVEWEILWLGAMKIYGTHSKDSCVTIHTNPVFESSNKKEKKNKKVKKFELGGI